MRQNDKDNLDVREKQIEIDMKRDTHQHNLRMKEKEVMQKASLSFHFEVGENLKEVLIHLINETFKQKTK